MSDNGATKDFLLPGEMSLSKDAIVKALAKPAVWGVGDNKKAVLLVLVTNRDTLLARVGESSLDLMATFHKWTRMTDVAVRLQRLKVVDVVGQLYETSPSSFMHITSQPRLSVNLQ
jgi:hypothetical protein